LRAFLSRRFYAGEFEAFNFAVKFNFIAGSSRLIHTRSIRSHPHNPWGLKSKKITMKAKGATSLTPPGKYLSK
jgi:hypothetical protein